MNLGQLRTAVDRRTGIAVDTTTQTAWINEVLQQIATEEAWPWLLTTTTYTGLGFTSLGSQYGNAFQSSAPIDNASPGSLMSVVMVRDTDGFIYDPAALVDVLSFGTGNGGGAATLMGDGSAFYAIWSNTLVITRDVPDTSSVLVRWLTAEADLTSDTQTPLLPSVYHGAIVELVALLTMERRGTRVDVGRAKGYQAQYTSLIGKMKKQALRQIAQQRLPRLRPGSGW